MGLAAVMGYGVVDEGRLSAVEIDSRLEVSALVTTVLLVVLVAVSVLVRVAFRVEVVEPVAVTLGVRVPVDVVPVEVVLGGHPRDSCSQHHAFH